MRGSVSDCNGSSWTREGPSNDGLLSKSEYILSIKMSLLTEGIRKGTGDSRVIPCILDRDVAIKRWAVVEPETHELYHSAREPPSQHNNLSRGALVKCPAGVYVVL